MAVINKISDYLFFSSPHENQNISSVFNSKQQKYKILHIFFYKSLYNCKYLQDVLISLYPLTEQMSYIRTPLISLKLKCNLCGISAFLCRSPVARRDTGVLPQRQSGAGGLQTRHEDRCQHPAGTVQAAAHPRHP